MGIGSAESGSTARETKLLLNTNPRDAHAVDVGEDALLLTASSSTSTLYTVPQVPVFPSKTSQKPFQFPWGKVVVILILNAVQPFAFELVFPFISAFPFFKIILKARTFSILI